MGYYDYQQNLIYRHISQDEGWVSHQQNCRRLIMKAIDYFKPEKVTVLGSGWLLELPLAEMLDNVNNVCLIDIVHPPDVIRQLQELKRVEIKESDITGGLIEEVWQKTNKMPLFRKLRSLDSIIIREYKPDTNPGIVISLNILTQLEVLLVDFLRKRAKIENDSFDKFRADIQKKHIDFLKNHRSVLITDIGEEFIDKSGKVTEVPSLYTELPEGQYMEEWTWDFDLKGSDYYEKRSVLKVKAIII
jgi:hypothetical protein